MDGAQPVWQPTRLDLSLQSPGFQFFLLLHLKQVETVGEDQVLV